MSKTILNALSCLLTGIFFVGLFRAQATAAAPAADPTECRPSPQQIRNSAPASEKILFESVGLPPDANDTQIVQLLDDPIKGIAAMMLVRYGKIHSAVPKLREIAGDGKATVLMRLRAAEALCSLGNTEFISSVVAAVDDVNGLMGASIKVDAARLLARTGDYSRFEFVAAQVGHTFAAVRANALKALEDFYTDPNELNREFIRDILFATAVQEKSPILREQAIWALEKIIKTEPQFTGRVIEALEANENAPDARFREVGKRLLMWHRKKMAGEQQRDPNQGGQQQ